MPDWLCYFSVTSVQSHQNPVTRLNKNFEIIFVKMSFLVVWQGSEYVFAVDF